MWTVLHILSTSILGPEEDCHPLNLVLGGRLCHSSVGLSGHPWSPCMDVPISATHSRAAFSTPIRHVYSLSILRVRSHKGICRAAFLYMYVSVLGVWVSPENLLHCLSQLPKWSYSFIRDPEWFCSLLPDPISFHNSSTRIFL